MLKTVKVPGKFAPLFEHAQKFVTRYFADQKATPERGTVEICGQRYVLVRAASMSVEFYEMVTSIYGEEAEAQAVAHSLLFDIAHAMGLADARSFAERMEVSDPIAKLSAGPVHFAHAGWAFVDISEDSRPSPDSEYYLLYDHPYSFESDAWLNAGRPVDRPVCVMNAGYSSGWCEHSFGLPLVAVEILCRAKGDGACRFIMAPPDRVVGHVAAYAHAHPEVASRIANAPVPGFFSKRTDPQLVRANLELERRAEQRARELSIINAELKRDIEERQRTEAALGASQELTQRLIEALPCGVVHATKEGAVLRANSEACRILGVTLEMISRSSVSDFENTAMSEDGSLTPVSEFPVVKAMTTGTAQTATLGLTRANGDVVWALFRAVPTRNSATHEINGAVVTFLDITDRKRFEDKMRHAQKLESLGVLAGGIAHDFNNLLVAILGNTSFAKNIAGADERLGPLLEEIETAARRAAELTKQMLDYSGQGKFRLESMDLPVVVREMTKLLKALIPKAVELLFRFQEGLAPIEADPTQIRQVIMNLITNAAESMGDRAGRVVISVDQRYLSDDDLDPYIGQPAAGTFLTLEVSDNGSGMEEDTKSRIFDPFFTTKFQGRGLGMATVLGIVRGHGGGIHIDSKPGMGTQVRVLLPGRIRPVEPQESGADRGAILVVDDDGGVQKLACRALPMKGYRVITASDGAEGVRTFEQYRDSIRLVLMDMTMPQMSGLEALREIRARGSNVPVLLSSGYDIERSGGAGEFDGVLEKPYSVEELWDAVEKALRARTSRT
jgi:PAS domain S-box-containing protein